MNRSFRRVLNLIPTPAVHSGPDGRLPYRARINLLIKFAILTPIAIFIILAPHLIWIIFLILLPVFVALGYTGKRKRARRRAAGHCENCNYDRAGLTAGALCPECGSPEQLSLEVAFHINQFACLCSAEIPSTFWHGHRNTHTACRTQFASIRKSAHL